MGLCGPTLAARYIANVIEHYTHQAHSRCSGARSAACHASAEVLAKLPIARVRMFAFALFELCAERTSDEEWTVRDAACAALGRALSSIVQRDLGALVPTDNSAAMSPP